MINPLNLYLICKHVLIESLIAVQVINIKLYENMKFLYSKEMCLLPHIIVNNDIQGMR